MELKINDYIEFGRLFDGLIDECKDDLIELQNEKSHYKEILIFFGLDRPEFSIEQMECDLTDNEITFSFYRVTQDANESDNNNTVETVLIVYSMVLSEFTYFNFESN